tara:strand:- start:10941 stop:14237 length:3297 start_codon:yes stop_codon:yes gene_type:complete
MATITQTIHSLNAGISQQPDEQKIPGQVKDMLNAIPDITQGLLKRPAGKFVSTLVGSTDTGKWFHYYRDESEQYVGQIQRDGTVKMWACAEVRDSLGNVIHQAGAPVTVVDDTATRASNDLYTYDDATTGNKYLKHSADDMIQTLTLNDFTYISNRNVIPEMRTDTANLEPEGDFLKEVFIELKSLSYAKQYAVNVFDSTDPADNSTVNTATRIRVTMVNSSNNYCDSGFHMRTHATRGDGNNARCGTQAGDGRDAFAPNVGTRIFSVDSNKTLVDDGATGGTLANGNLSDINYEYQVNIHKKPFGGQYTQANNSNIVTVTTATPHGLSVGTSMFFDFVTGGLVNEDTFKNVTSVPSATTFTFSTTATNTSGSNHSGDVNSSETAQTGRKNLYFRIATTGQSVPYTEGSGSSQTTTYQARYTTTYDLLHGGEGWLKGDFFYVFMKDAYYKVEIEESSASIVQANLALVRPNPTPFDTETTITAESILGDIRAEITGNDTNTGNGFTCTQIGTGLHIKRTSNFNASTPVGELLNVVAGKVNDVGDLPSQCKHGMVVEVVNSTADEDNHYVKFFGNNDKDGEGTWEECAKPGRAIKFNETTMPVILIRTADGNFRLTEQKGGNYTIAGQSYPVPQWDNAIVGDDVTNPEPSFIGKPITQMLFFRNRFALLSDEHIVMSRPGDFTNFFAKSAIQLIASDPIDIAASSEYPAILYDGIQVNTGLILFSKNQQFMLTTDSDVFSPTTAKINALSTYNFNFKTNPISLGTTIGFLDNAGKHSRFFEMAQVQREGEPQVIEQSAVVAKLFENDLSLISNSRENSIILFSEDNQSTLYGYRYFDQITERKLASWFRWTLPGTIKYHCMQDDALFVVIQNGSQRELLKFSIRMDSNTVALGDDRVHLDYLMPVTSLASSAYSGGNTTFTKPSGLNGNGQLAVYDIDDPANPALTIGNYQEATVSGSNIVIPGDWTGQNFYIGYLYTMSITMPTIYYVTKVGENFRADTRSNTIIHRVKLGFGPIGIYETVLSRVGRDDYTELFEVTPADRQLANRTTVFEDNLLRTVPVYDRNINATLTIKSTHPAPANFHTLTWEGVYNNNFYQRV